MKKSLNKKKLVILFITILIVGILFGILKRDKEVIQSNYDNELLRTMAYEEFSDVDANVEGTDNIKFSAFFLCDRNRDGYAEKLKGTCKEVGSQDTLYMEIIVQTEGSFKGGKIQIDGKNFYLSTSLPKDNELKNNFISTNLKTIEFEELNSGTQKLLTGIVRSGDYTKESTRFNAIGDNINNYSNEDNKIILTGTYVKANGEEVPIRKEVKLTTDWHGKASTSIKSTNQNYNDIDNRINEDEGNIRLEFSIRTEEIKKELILKSNHVEGTIPQLNGYNPISVKQTNNNGDFTYDESTRKFTLTRNATTNENGKILSSVSRYQTYSLEVIYPIDAYESLETESVSIKIPVEAYYEGYNNPNEGFENPYKTNIARTTIISNYSKEKGEVANLNIKVGKYVSSPSYHYMVSKKKPLRLYNEISTEEKNDYYTVSWEAYTGSQGDSSGVILSETREGTNKKTDTFIKTNSSEDSMEDITTNVGIYFFNADGILGHEGEIKLYNDETGELVHTFYSNEWNKYTSTNPFKYSTAIKHVKIVTSKTNKNSSLNVYHIKELDDEKISTKYSKEEFSNLQYIKSNLSMYINGAYLESKTNQAVYEAPYSYAKISLSKNVISTQATEKNMDILIETIANEDSNQEKWTNGTFLIKLPDEILDIKINELLSNSLFVKDDSAELIENDKGKFIRVKTSNVNPASYKMIINCDITPDPRIATVSKNLELYAVNEDAINYFSDSEDLFDVDSDENITERVNKTTTSISLVAPNSLLTNQTISEYDNSGNIVVSPKIANLKPIYGNEQQEKQIAKIGAQLKNNYSSTISEVIILGKIPYEGNNYVLSEGNLGSTFSTTMTNQGLIVPSELEGKVTVYYTTNENPSKNLADANNNWKTKDEIQDWTQIKSWLVDFGDTIIDKGNEYTFYYNIEIPFGIELNKVAYSHHGIYFSLDTPDGKYRTKTEPNEIGIRIAEKYNLSVTKYQKNLEKKIQGATYRISKLDDVGHIEETQTAKTNAEGLLMMTNLYAEKIYEIKEIATSQDYELNGDVIKIIAHVNNNTGELTIEKLQGTTKGELEVIKIEGEDYKVAINVEDETNAKLKIVKYENESDTLLNGTKFSIIGEGLPDEGKIIKTNASGEANISGLKIGKEYILEETKATEGYYLHEGQIKFSINNNEGVYTINVLEGNIKASSVTQENDFPVALIEIEDEKIPRYNLIINKIEKNSIDDSNPKGTPVVGAKFILFKGEQEQETYITDNQGHITLNDLYQFEENKNIDQTYSLKEIYSPVGYAKTKDITFSSTIKEGKLVLNIDDYYNYSIEGTTINLIVEDSKSFKLVKKDGENGTLLPNVKFAIYNVDEGMVPARNSKGEILGKKEIINGKEYYTLTTNSRGEVTADLPEGVYRAIEVEAANKYDLTNQEKTFGIGASTIGRKYASIEYIDDMALKQDNGIYPTGIYATKDGGYIARGLFWKDRITIDGYVFTKSIDRDGSLLIKYSNNHEIEWVKELPIREMYSAKNGDLILVSDYSDNITINNQTYTSKGSSDVVIFRMTLQGEIKWIKTFGGIEKEEVGKIIENSDGDILVTFTTNSQEIIVENDNILLDEIENYIEESNLLISLSNDGEMHWIKNLFIGNIKSCAVIEEGGFYIAGEFNDYYHQHSTIQVGDFTLQSKGETDAMLAKYSNDGNVEWAKSFGGNEYDEISKVETTPDNGCVVGIPFTSDSIEIENNSFNNNNHNDFILLKYSQEGNLEWTQYQEIDYKSSDNNVMRIFNNCLTSDGGFILGGTWDGKGYIKIGDYYLTNHDADEYWEDTELVLIKYSKNKEIEWVKTIGGTASEAIWNIIELKPSEYLMYGEFTLRVAGEQYYDTYYASANNMVIKLKEKQTEKYEVVDTKNIVNEQTVIINNVIATNDNGYITTENVGNNGFIKKYNSQNEIEWSKKIENDNNGQNFISSIIYLDDGNYLISGQFNGKSISLENETILNTNTDDSNHSSDAFLIALSPYGELVWYKLIGNSSGNESINRLVKSEKDGYYILGNYTSDILRLENGDDLIGTNAYENKHEFQNVLPGTDAYLNNADLYKGDNFILKNNSQNELEYVISKTGHDYLKNYYCNPELYDYRGAITEDVQETNDDGLIIMYYMNCEEFDSNIINKYNGQHYLEWSKATSGSPVLWTQDRKYCEFKDIIKTKNDELILAGNITGTINFYKNSNSSVYICRRNKTTTPSSILIKLDKNGNYLDYKTELFGIERIIETSNGGFCSVGSGLVKYNDKLEIETQYQIAPKLYEYDILNDLGNNQERPTIPHTKLNDICENNGLYFAVGNYINNIQFGDYSIEDDTYDTKNGIIYSLKGTINAAEEEVVEFDNFRKEFKITTDIEEINGVKGGIIYGEDLIQYESVKYGDTNVKPIKMIPDENYYITSITINGKPCEFSAEDDGSYTLPAINNIREDKHIVVTYSLKDNIIIFKKVDKNTREGIPNVELKLDQIEEEKDLNPEEIIGPLLNSDADYSFIEETTMVNGEEKTVYKSTNQGIDNSYCKSIVPIDLTNYSGKYEIIVNSKISTSSGDQGYATLSLISNPSPGYNDNSPTYKRIVSMSQYYTNNEDKSIEVEGGYKYYLHLGYYKNNSTNSYDDDTFTINSIKVNKSSDSNLYTTNITTNEYGIAKTQLPFGKYKLTEINTPEGYISLDEPVIIEFRNDGTSQHEFTIENERKAKVIVHHYKKGTDNKLAEDEELYGSVDQEYSTSPKLDIPRYSLDINENDEYILPTNASGKFTSTDIEVIYYYVPAQATVIVNHYIDGTETPVPLNDGTNALREIKNGNIGDTYTTEELSTDNLDARYEISEIPDNKKGTFEDETIVNYYYRLKTFNITTDVDEYNQTDILGNTETIRGGDVLGEDENPYERVNHSENSIKDIIASPEDGYKVETITINDQPTDFNPENSGNVVLSKFTDVTEDKHVVVKFAKKTSNVIVHHYIEGTENRVESKFGGEVQDVTTIGAVGKPYVTKPTDELSDRYELVTTPNNASGTFANETIEVTYYYKEVPAKVFVNHFIENTTTPVPLKNGGTASQEIINGYVTKDYSTNKLENISDDYTYVSDSGNTSGKMTTKDIIVNYYYARKAYAQINYIAINSNESETTLETVDYEGIDKESYTAYSKDFDGYKLVEKPPEETKILDKDNITIFNYYYRKNTGLLEKHIDLYSNKLLDNKSYEGNVGDEYSVENKEFAGYVLATNKKYYEKQGLEVPDDKVPEEPYIPNNHQGKLKEEPEEVKFYYVKETEVIVKYLEKNTNEPVDVDKIIEGYEKDPYKIEPKEIEGYDLVTEEGYAPTNTEGEMSKETITVIYYYGIKAEVEVNHIYLLNESIIDTKIINGYYKDLYKTDYLDNEQFKYYRPTTNKEYYEYAAVKDSKLLTDNGVKTVGELLAKLDLSEYDPYIPSNSKGELAKSKIIVNYYYIKQAPIVVKYIDEETGKEIEKTEEELKDVGDPYHAQQKVVEKYEIDMDKLPNNVEGFVSEDGIEVIYYYKKAKEKTSIIVNEKTEGPQTGDSVVKITLGVLSVIFILNIIESIHIRNKGTKKTRIIK